MNNSVESPSLLQKILLAAGGIAGAFLVGVIVILAFPGLLPKEATQSRYERLYEDTTYEVNFHITDGDMFVFYPGRIRPPEEDTLLQKFTLRWDADGFRVPAQPAEAYPIAAFGDSYTEGYNVPQPYPDLLSEELGIPVRNYGYRGYSPIESAQAVQEFAAVEPRQWVIYTFFSGNDLGEITRAVREPIQKRSPTYLITFLAEQASQNIESTISEQTSEHYDYPMPVIIGGNYYEMTLLDLYLWSQFSPQEGFAASRNAELLNDALDKMEAAVPQETCLAFVFAPNRAQLYYPYIYKTEKQWLLGLWHEQVIDDQGFIQQEQAPPPPNAEELILERLNDQYDFILEVMADRPRWHFIDMMPAFREAVANGELLFYRHDTHWNPAGHRLTAQTIAEGLRQAESCLLE